MDSMIHVTSSRPFFLPGSVSVLLSLPRKEECKFHPLGQLQTAFSLCFAA